MMTEGWMPQSDHDHAVMHVLTSVRTLSDAIDRMHSGMKGDMDMNATDLAALRLLIMREQQGRSVSPREIAAHLRISTASTTKLLDRLVDSGHVERRPHPGDRRSRIVVLTDASRQAFLDAFGNRLREMRAAATEYDAGELAMITRFLDQLSVALDPPG